MSGFFIKHRGQRYIKRLVFSIDLKEGWIIKKIPEKRWAETGSKDARMLRQEIAQQKQG